MKKLAKRYAESVKLVEKDKEYEIKEALDLVEKSTTASAIFGIICSIFNIFSIFTLKTSIYRS